MFSPDTEERWKMDVVYGREKGTNCFWVFFFWNLNVYAYNVIHGLVCMNTTHDILDVKCFQMHQCTDNVRLLKLVKVVFRYM